MYIAIVHLIVKVLERAVAYMHFFPSQSFKSNLNELRNGSRPTNVPKLVVSIAMARHVFVAADVS